MANYEVVVKKKKSESMNVCMKFVIMHAGIPASRTLSRQATLEETSAIVRYYTVSQNWEDK